MRALPVTWRPRRARIVAYAMAVAVLVCTVVTAVALPAGAGGFALGDRLGFIALGLVIASFMHILARPRVSADADGVTVVNLFRRRRLEWAEIVGVNLRSATRGVPGPR